MLFPNLGLKRPVAGRLNVDGYEGCKSSKMMLCSEVERSELHKERHFTVESRMRYTVVLEAFEGLVKIQKVNRGNHACREELNSK